MSEEEVRALRLLVAGVCSYGHTIRSRTDLDRDRCRRCVALARREAALYRYEAERGRR